MTRGGEGVAVLAGVKVRMLSCYLDGYCSSTHSFHRDAGHPNLKRFQQGLTLAHFFRQLTGIPASPVSPAMMNAFGDGLNVGIDWPWGFFRRSTHCAGRLTQLKYATLMASSLCFPPWLKDLISCWSWWRELSAFKMMTWRERWNV